MNKLEIFNKFGRYVQRKVLSGKPLVTVRELWQLIKEGHISPQMIGYWLKEQGFGRIRAKRAGKGFTTEYFLNKEGIEIVRKKNRIGVKCGYSCGWTGYYDMLPEEEFAVGSSSYIEKIGHPEQWKLMYCKACNREDHWAHYNIEATKNVRKLKDKVIFSARKINIRGDLARGDEGSFEGPGCLGVPDNLKGPW